MKSNWMYNLVMGELPDQVYRAKAIKEMASGTPDYNHIVLCMLGKANLSLRYIDAVEKRQYHKERRDKIIWKVSGDPNYCLDTPPEAEEDQKACGKYAALERQAWAEIEQLRSEAISVLDNSPEYQRYLQDNAYP